LFESLARQQLAPAAERTPGTLRPRLPYLFDDGPAADHPAATASENPIGRSGSSPELSPPSPESSQSFPGASPEVYSDAPFVAPEAVRVQPAQPSPPIKPSRSWSGEPGPLERERVRPAPPPAATRPQPAVQGLGDTGGRIHSIEQIVQVHSVRGRESTQPPVSAAPQRDGVPRAFEGMRPAARSNPMTPLRAVVESRTASEPTIEIHIGRLEVRAPAGSAAEMARPQASPPDRRLAAYLRGRGNGARS